MSEAYHWKGGSLRRCGITADEAAEEIKRLTAESQDGLANPHEIVKASRNKKALLHEFFEWEDDVAADEFRLSQARNLVADIVIVVDDAPDQRIPAFVNVRINDEDEPSVRGYVDSRVVMKDAFMRERALEDAHKGLVAWTNRYSSLSELADEVTTIRRVAKKVEKKASKTKKKRSSKKTSKRTSK